MFLPFKCLKLHFHMPRWTVFLISAESKKFPPQSKFTDCVGNIRILSHITLQATAQLNPASPAGDSVRPRTPPGLIISGPPPLALEVARLFWICLLELAGTLEWGCDDFPCY